MSFSVRCSVASVNKATAILSVVMLSVLVAVSALQVFFRYVLLEPLIWSEEVARYLLVWLSFAAGGLVLSTEGHPRIEAISETLPPRIRAVNECILQFLVAAFLVVFIWVSTGLAGRYIGFISLGSGISQSIPRFALPVGGFLMLVNLFPKLMMSLSRLRHLDRDSV
ncbi:TRAP transporter small permease [Pseudohoeflea coraliihabitans]|uniref:TRAP transporter small permease protein n=1 Tax=Pseudohoeflea coraliihabitans TaxID=2860393 RepID=A0ABS6WMK0_9HYPH|nr:TRAP transporter small permease [Pseudohoeflea sp. DP4N28-3]MBW3097191.1 TRAP transporter small permease [Pseudohoeflea sp. DP4N28-3]